MRILRLQFSLHWSDGSERCQGGWDVPKSQLLTSLALLVLRASQGGDMLECKVSGDSSKHISSQPFPKLFSLCSSEIVLCLCYQVIQVAVDIYIQPRQSVVLHMAMLSLGFFLQFQTGT